VLFGDEVEHLQHFDPVTGEVIEDDLEHVAIWPASHYNVREGMIEDAVAAIGAELNERCAELEAEGKLLESHRLRQRTQYDMEMLREIGFCSGIENYSGSSTAASPASGRTACSTTSPTTSSASSTSPTRRCRRSAACTRATARASRRWSTTASGCRARSTTGRRPSRSSSRSRRRSCSSRRRRGVRAHALAADRRADRAADGDHRPGDRGARDPQPDRRPDERDPGRVERDERTLVTTLTKKMSEDLTDYLLEMGFKVRYLHSEIDTLERIQIIRELRLGEFDVLVGVNLLREGLDLPEVSLVAILDADKEGFLRGETSLIQTIGRAARNIEGKVLMYADKETAAMRAAISETDRRRAIQRAYNEEHGITPGDDRQGDLRHRRVPAVRLEGAASRRRRQREAETMPPAEIERTIVELEEEMLAAAEDLRFEYAAKLRDEIRDLKRELDRGRRLARRPADRARRRGSVGRLPGLPSSNRRR
jgi:excinuclease ABC subunit B